MTVVAGTDFSNSARDAARAAAAIAKRLGTPLKLVHVLDELGAEATLAKDQGFVFDGQRSALEHHAEELRRAFDVEVDAVLLAGDAERTLAAVAEQSKAELLVVSSLGDAKPHAWLVGSVAERAAQLCTVPTVLVRDGERLVAWARGERTLKVMVGVELSSASRSALHFAARLRKVAPCDLTVVQVVWPLGEHLRLGVPLPIPADHLRPELEGPLVRDLRAWVGALPGEGATSLLVSPGYSRVDAHLAALAAEHDADLLVVGAHRRSQVARLWQGSVSRGVLHQATCSVASVPAERDTIDERDLTQLGRLLVPTDLSPLSNRALATAYGVVASGGTVHLLHVVEDGKGGDLALAQARLRELAPAAALARGVRTEVEVLEHKEPFLAITQAAARLGADAICMATHGRSGLSQLALGSQAQQVVARAHCPVLLVPPERAASERSF